MPVQLIPLGSLTPHSCNPRKHVDPDYIGELARSMAENGQLDPIICRPLPDGRFQIIAGHCRTEAAKLLKWESLRGDVRDVTDEQADFLAVESNLARKNLSEVEEAEGIAHMMTTHGWTQSKVAERFNKTQAWVSYRLALLQLAPEVKEQVITQVINPTQGREIAKAPVELQAAIAAKTVKADLSKDQVQRLVRVVSDETTPADVRKAVLESLKVTPEHAAAIAKLPTQIERQGFIRAVESGRLTPEETTREVEAAIQPRTVGGERARRHLEVGSTLVKAKDLLEEIGGHDIAGLDAQALRMVEGRLMELKSCLDQLSMWVTAARGRRQEHGKNKSGRVLTFPTGTDD